MKNKLFFMKCYVSRHENNEIRPRFLENRGRIVAIIISDQRKLENTPKMPSDYEIHDSPTYPV